MNDEEKIENVSNELNAEFDNLEKHYIEKFRKLDAGNNYATAMMRNAQVCKDFSNDVSEKLLPMAQEFIIKYPINGLEQKLSKIIDSRTASILNKLMGLD